MALRIYRSPEGFTFQYEEGTQPVGYEPVDEPKPKPAARKRRTTANKAVKPDNK